MKEMKRWFLILVCIILTVLTALIIIRYQFSGTTAQTAYDDGIEQVDLNKIKLEDSGVEVSFSDVILSKPHETRKLIVMEQNASISTQLTDRLIEAIDFEFMKKTQNVTYSGTGYFVVDLDHLAKEDISEDSTRHTVTIKINHAYLETIEIDPNKIFIGDVNQSLLAKGNIKMSVSDYKSLERSIQSRMKESLNTASNGQVADQKALKMVEEVYEPVVEAVDPRYTVVVQFK